MALTATLFAHEADERRGSGRRPVTRESTLRDGAARPHPAIVHDLSCDGCLIETPLPLAPGMTVGVGLAGVGRREAIVVRVEGARYGCRFADPLTPQALDHAFAADPVVSGGFAPLPTPLDLSHEPHVAKWSPAVRVAIMMGSATMLWSVILKLV